MMCIWSVHCFDVTGVMSFEPYQESLDLVWKSQIILYSGILCVPPKIM